MRRLLLAALAAGTLLVTGCARNPAPEVDGVRFAPVTFPRGVEVSNAELAEDFLLYTFALETGETLDRLLRYEEPVTVHFRPGLADYRPDIDALFHRLREEAEIDIREAATPEAALIVVETVPRAELDRVFREAACFIVPGESGWRSFVRKRPEEVARWGELERLGRAAIFLPADTDPQDARDCLHEEITQALGPANDLYRIADTIWNDDNLHGIATPRDMLMLRVLYSPWLRAGMSREEVAARLPAVLARLNPRGKGIEPRARHPESRPWNSAIEVALSRHATHAERRGAARIAVGLAREMRPVDHRLAVSLLALGRLELRRNPAAAAGNFLEAYDLSRRLHGDDDIRTAHAAAHLAAMALAAGSHDTAIRLASAHLDGARNGQNAVLLAGLKSIEAEALLGLGQLREAQAARLDSLRWARYGLGDGDGRLAREQAALAEILSIDADASGDGN